MDVLNQLEAWFQDQDYETGLIILAKLSKNRVLIQNLTRKKFPEKLHNELKKMAGLHHAKISTIRSFKSETTKELDGMLQTKSLNSDEIIGNKLNDFENAADELSGMKLLELESSAEDVITDKIEELEILADEYLSGKRKTIAQKRHINYEDLPSDLQYLWIQNRDSYKEIRALHEKLKLMERATPEDRQPLTNRIASLDELIRTNWETIDAWDPEAQPKEIIPIEVDFKRLSANRKYISNGLKKLSQGTVPETKLPELKKNMLMRAREITSAGENFSPDTIRDLQSFGISI